jgi:hypothetical protein
MITIVRCAGAEGHQASVREGLLPVPTMYAAQLFCCQVGAHLQGMGTSKCSRITSACSCRHGRPMQCSCSDLSAANCFNNGLQLRPYPS